jgi:DNA-binding response OmpR family regulator
MLNIEAVQTGRSYRQLAAQQRDKAMTETLPNVRLLLERSAEKWEAMADAITPTSKLNEAHQLVSASDDRSCIVRVGSLIVNRAKRLVLAKGAAIRLSPKEFALVELLAEHAGSPVTKQMLMEHIYTGSITPDPKIIDVFVCKVRKKLSRVCDGQNVIQTYYRSGYLLTANAA